MFVLVIVLGYAASRWRRPDNAVLERWGLEEWGLGGRAFGNPMQFFLLGGDLYTAYSFIAVPALVYGLGAAGFYAVAFAVIAYPLVFLTVPRLWSVAHSHGFVSAAEFVRARFGSRALSALVAPAVSSSCRSSRRPPSVCTQTGSIGGRSSLAPSRGWPAASSCSTRFRASGPAAWSSARTSAGIPGRWRTWACIPASCCTPACWRWA